MTPTEQDMEERACREAFEAHTLRLESAYSADQIKRGATPEKRDILARKPSGSYVDKLVYAAWEGWRSAWDIRNIQPPNTKSDFQEMIKDAKEHYSKTGCYKPEHIHEILGSPSESVGSKCVICWDNPNYLNPLGFKCICHKFRKDTQPPNTDKNQAEGLYTSPKANETNSPVCINCYEIDRDEDGYEILRLSNPIDKNEKWIRYDIYEGRVKENQPENVGRLRAALTGMMKYYGEDGDYSNELEAVIWENAEAALEAIEDEEEHLANCDCCQNFMRRSIS